MADYKGPKDYIDVAARIVDFRGQYPAGSLQPWKDPYIERVEISKDVWKSYVVYSAAAYRSPDDKLPGVGYAWEPMPGPTPFTKDSEMQNAETAAWGRAMVAALAVDTKKGIASMEEVRNRSGNVPAKIEVQNTPEIKTYDEKEVSAASDWIDTVADILDIIELKKIWSEQAALLDVPANKDTLKAAINRQVAEIKKATK